MKNTIHIDLIPHQWRDKYFSSLNPFIELMNKINANPNLFTTIGLFLSSIAAYLAATGELRLSALFLLFAGICDSIDGKLARASGKVTKFGALLDSTLDRYSEVVFFFGMAYYFVEQGQVLTTFAIAVGLGGSLMVSYVRARAEGLGFDCKVGIMQRPERLLLLVIGALIHQYTLIAAVWVVAVMSNVTAIHRILHVWKKDRNERLSSS